MEKQRSDEEIAAEHVTDYKDWFRQAYEKINSGMDNKKLAKVNNRLSNKGF